MGLMDLPNEIMLQILCYVDAKTLLSTSRVNQRLHDITQDSSLVKLHPHHIIQDRAYLNEHVYSSKELLLEVFRTDSADLSWLVKGTTAVIRESGLTTIGWYLLQNGVRYALERTVEKIVTDDVARTYVFTLSGWDVGLYHRGQSATWAATCHNNNNINDWRLHVLMAVNRAQSSATAAASDYVTEADVLEYLLGLRPTDPIEIGKRAYEIAECLMIRKIDRALCLRIHSIVNEHCLLAIPFLPSFNIPDNPWIRQYNELRRLRSIAKMSNNA